MAATLDPKLNTGRNPYQQSKPASATTSAITAAVQSAKPVTLPKLPFQTSRASLAPTVQKSTAPTAPSAPAPVTNAPATTAPTTTAPATGALNYNTATTAQKQGMQDNWARLNSDSDYLASEIARAQAKIASNQAAGLSTDAQNDYLTRLTGISSGSPQPTSTGSGSTGTNNFGLPSDLSWLGANASNEVAAQIAAYQAQQEAAKQAAQFGVDQNNQYLSEQIAALQQQRAVDQDALQQQQNRFGGLYSGGLNYQGGTINRSYANQEGSLSRDIAARNQQLLDQYGTQANAIAQQIQQLQSNEPGIIRDRINDYLNQYADRYGYNPLNPNQTTSAQRTANLNAAINVGNQTGYNVSPQNDYSGLFRQVVQGKDAMGNTLTKTAAQVQTEFENAYNAQRDKIDDAYRNRQISLQEAQEARFQLQQDYDEAYRRYGLQDNAASTEAEYNGLTPNQVLDSIQRNYRDENGKIPAANKQSVYEAIIDAGLTDAQTDQLLAVSGLTKKEIEAFNKQYGVGE